MSNLVAKQRTAWALAAFVLITVLTIARPALVLMADEALTVANLAGLALYTFPVVGILIAVHRPGNAIAWLCLAVGMVWALEGALWGAAYYGFARAWPSPRPELVAMAGDAFVMPGLFLVATLFLLLFPDGRLPSPRWRWAMWLSFFIIAGMYLLSLVNSDPFGWGRPQFENPLAIDDDEVGWLAEIAVSIFVFTAFLTVAACVLALVLRYRRSAGIERLQLRWLTAAGSAAISVWFIAVWVLERAAGENIALIVSVAVFTLIPASIGLAILRYRLYDIDRIINRTLVYGTLTAALGTIYFAVVVGLQALLQPISGGSDLAIVLTTLVVAALFLPARRRVQEAVDRRFNRHAYDAARTVEAFSARLREQVDLDSLHGELLAVVAETMQPARAMLWLRRPVK